MSRRLSRILVVVVACLVGWGIIVYNLHLESMWTDEWFSWMYSQMNPFDLTRATAQDVHPPLYYLSVWLWTGISGSQTLLVMRLTAAFPALLAIAVCYRVGRNLFRSHNVGVAAAFFLATSGVFIYYGRELRMYALIALLVAASWWYLWRWLSLAPQPNEEAKRANKRRAAAIGYAVLLALMAYTYYFAAFALIAQFVYVLLYHRRQVLRLFRLYIGALIAWLPWLPVLLDQLYWERQRSGRSELIGKYGATDPTSWREIDLFVNTYTAQQPAYAFLLVLLAFIFAYTQTTSPALRRGVVAAGMWFFLTITTFFTLNLVFPIYNLRYPFTIITGLALLIGAAVALLPLHRWRAAVIAFIVIVGAATHYDAFLPPKRPDRELLQTVAAGYQDGDRIWYNMTLGARGSRLIEETAYHLQFDAPTLNSDWFVWDAPRDYEDVNAVRRVWDVRSYWLPPVADALPPLQNGRVVSEVYLFGEYEIRLYEAPPADQAPIQVTRDDQPLFLLRVSPPNRSIYNAGDTVLLKTWWEAAQQPLFDYSTVLMLRRAGAGETLAQVDNGLLSIDSQPTSAWSPDAPFILATPELILPSALPAGEYEVWLGVYYWENPTRLSLMATGATSPALDETDLVLAATLVVE